MAEGTRDTVLEVGAWLIRYSKGRGIKSVVLQKCGTNFTPIFGTVVNFPVVDIKWLRAHRNYMLHQPDYSRVTIIVERALILSTLWVNIDNCERTNDISCI